MAGFYLFNFQRELYFQTLGCVYICVCVFISLLKENLVKGRLNNLLPETEFSPLSLVMHSINHPVYFLITHLY